MWGSRCSPDTLSPTFHSLSNANYRLYAAGSLVSNTGTWMQRVAQDWLVLQLHHGSAATASVALGVTTGLQFLPMLLLSPAAGLAADRFPKRRLLQCTQVAMGAVSVLLGILALTGTVTTAMVFGLAFAFGVAAAFDAPARQAFVSEMVDPVDVPNAVSLNSASFNMARLIGPASAGLLIAALGSGVAATGWVILGNGLSYLAVIWALQRMSVRDLHVVPAAPRGRGMIREGLRYVRRRPDLKFVLVIGFFAGTFGMNFQMTSALMATQVYDKGAGEYGVLGTVLAVGSLAGALAGARRSSQPRHRLVVIGAISFGVVEILLGLMPSYLTFALTAPLLGFSLLTLLNSANVTVQLTTDPQLRGRVMSLYMMVVMGGTPIGAPFIGWVGATFGARWTLIGGGLLSLLGLALAWWRYGAQTFEAASTAPLPEAGVEGPRPRIAV